MKTDIEIAQEATMKPITQIAAQLGLADEDVIPYGRYKAKINHRLIHNAKKQGKLILVTANIREFFDAGCISVGLASSLMPKDAVAANDWEACAAYVRGMVDQIQR